jgi:imidazole glycerol phosphate synthase subunit HisF
MLNKYFGVIATVALTLSPLSAFAQQAQINSQGASNSGVASGVGNTVVQNVDQDSLQNQVDVDGYYKGNDPQLQVNKQDAANSGAAIGAGNLMIQNVDQDSLQNQFGY